MLDDNKKKQEEGRREAGKEGGRKGRREGGRGAGGKGRGIGQKRRKRRERKRNKSDSAQRSRPSWFGGSGGCKATQGEMGGGNQHKSHGFTPENGRHPAEGGGGG